MTDSNYSPPVNRLLTYGKLDFIGHENWPDYVQERGIGPEHIPDLIRMATDPDLNSAPEDSVQVWAPTHAWRALGELQAADAVVPLLGLLADEDDDWSAEELPEVFARIGAGAIPVLGATLADADQSLHTRIIVMTALGKIAEQHPDAREECVALLMRQLERFQDQDEEINGFLISTLMDLDAEEALPLMEQATKSGKVDPMLATWDDVQIEFGLKTPEEVGRDPEMPQADPLRVRRMQEQFGIAPAPPVKPLRPSATARTGAGGASPGDKAKSKRKMAKDSRKKNKKRK